METSKNNNDPIRKNNFASCQIDNSINPITIRTFELSPVPNIIVGILPAIATAVAVNYTSNLPPSANY